MMGVREQGFSLLELSIVLAIISVMLMFGINIAGSALKGSERITTTERLKAVKSALEAYVKVNGYLPCPSSRALTPSDTTYGTESRNLVDCTTSGAGLTRAPATGTPYAYIGAVPTRTLSIPDNYAVDAWGNKFTYMVSSQHVGAFGAYATTDGPIIVRAGDRSGTNYIITTLREDDGTNAAGAAGTYAVISHGADGKGAYPQNGTAVTTACGSSTTLTDVENCDDANLTIYDSTYNDGDNDSTYFDDYVAWGSNALERMPTTLGGLGTGCGSGPCELWCATCDAAYGPTFTPAVICNRTITSTNPCKMLCEYAYPTNNIYCP